MQLITRRRLTMALRPLRNATITFGLVSIPVRFYSATKSEDIHFNLLHESCGTRVNRKWWCPYHEKIVSSDELVRGYAITKSKYVTFTDEEIETLETDDNRALDITEFVDLGQIDPVFYEKAYFLGPAPGGGKTYHLLATAMKDQNKVGVARWVAAGKEHVVLLRPFEDGRAAAPKGRARAAAKRAPAKARKPRTQVAKRKAS